MKSSKIPLHRPTSKRSNDHNVPKIYKARMAADTRVGHNFLPITAKQMFFVLNGHPTRMHRVLLNPLKPRDINALLEEISQGLQVAILKLYSYDGERISSVEQLLKLKEARALAVPRHERPILSGEQAFILPPIGRGGSKSLRTSSSSREGKNSMERLTAPPLPKSTLRRHSPPVSFIPRPTNFHRNSFTADPEIRSTRHTRALIAGPAGVDSSGLFRTKRLVTKQQAPKFSNNNHQVIAEASLTRIPLSNNKVKKASTTDDSGTELRSPNNHHHALPPNASGGANSLPSTSTLDSDSGRPRSAIDDTLLLDIEQGSVKTPSAHSANGSVRRGSGRSAQRRRHSSAHIPPQSDLEEEEDPEQDDYPEQPEALREINYVEEEEVERNDQAWLDPLDKIEEEGNGSEGGEDIAEDHSHNVNESHFRKKRLKTIEEMPESSRLSTAGANANKVGEKEIAHESPTILAANEMSSEKEPAQTPIEFFDEEEDDEEREQNKAATVIQANWRGYRVRKALKKTQFNLDVEIIPTPENLAESSLDNLPSLEIATPQLLDPGTNEEELRDLLGADLPEAYLEKTMDSSSDREGEEVHGTNYLVAEMGGLLEPSLSSEGLDKKRAKDPDTFTYSITIITGNRWAADTEADLYIILYGDNDQCSDKLRLCQDYVNWLQTAEPKFRQNQSDTFQVDLNMKLGVIGRITIGHEHVGYGAGIFIDRILVTEEPDDDDQAGRQFLFLCNKWLDSGQVDGKIERNIRLSSFYDIASLPTDNRVTKGRWELIIHSGNAQGQGATTSNLSISGYGTRGRSKTADIYDSRLAKVPSEALIQVDFGDIGELLKIRIEVDGSGESPDYFLNFVELKDLDTDEQFAVMCGKWLRWNSTEKGAQPFRELLAFHVGIEPLPLINYEGKLRLLPNKIHFAQSQLRIELYGDLGETGFVRLFFDENNNNIIAPKQKDGKIEISFKMESVSIGRVYGARLYFDPTLMGEALYQGFFTMQEIFRRVLPDISPPEVGCDWLVGQITLRESTHTPYRYVLKQSRVHNQLSSDEMSVMAKELLTTEMEGISTKINKKKAGKRLEANFILSMAIADNSTLLPIVTLCGEKKVCLDMRNLDSIPTDNIISYQLKTSKIGTLRKLRISVGKERLKVPPRSQDNTRAQPNDFVGIHKIRLCDTANGDELRFPSAEVELFEHSIYEFAAIFPDQPPIPIVVYAIHVSTGKSSSSEILVRLNLTGESGDIGNRALMPDPLEAPPKDPSFQPNTNSLFDLEAVSIGEINSVAVSVEWLNKQKDSMWECNKIVVTDSNTSLFYAFKFPRPFTPKLSHQNTTVLPFTDPL